MYPDTCGRTLWLFGAEASLYAYIGMFMLMGIVKKNGIMIVDFAEQRVREELPTIRRFTTPACNASGQS